MGLFDWVEDAINDAIDWAIENLFRKPLNGIMMVIETVKRIVCFFESIPKRGRNITHGVNNIFSGVAGKFKALGESAEAGYNSTTTFVGYSGEWAISRTECIIKFIINLYKCIFFYILKCIGNICYILIVEPIKYFSYKLGMNADKRIEQISIAIEKMDTIFYSFFGFHLIYFPKSIREDCFVCKRLKNSAVSKKADDVADTFNKKIPEIMKRGGATQFNRADRQFKESSKVYVREPWHVH